MTLFFYTASGLQSLHASLIRCGGLFPEVGNVSVSLSIVPKWLGGKSVQIPRENIDIQLGTVQAQHAIRSMLKGGFKVNSNSKIKILTEGDLTGNIDKSAVEIFPDSLGSIKENGVLQIVGRFREGDAELISRSNLNSSPIEVAQIEILNSEGASIAKSGVIEGGLSLIHI